MGESPMTASTIGNLKVISLPTLLFLLAAVSLPAQECNRLRHASSGELVSCLDGTVSNPENAACITFAIQTLGEEHYEPAIPVLTKLLDFRRPRTPEESGVITMHSFYPAMIALEEIGRASLPSLLRAIKGELSVKARENAVSAWMEIHKYESPKGVALLKREANEANDVTVKQRLLWAVSKALHWCDPSDEAQCKKAAKAGIGSGRGSSLHKWIRRAYLRCSFLWTNMGGMTTRWSFQEPCLNNVLLAVVLD